MGFWHENHSLFLDIFASLFIIYLRLAVLLRAPVVLRVWITLSTG